MEDVDQEQMSKARYGSPLALVHERFILALGGYTNNSELTLHCEAFDTQSNYWFKIKALPFPTSNTTAIVMDETKVYLMPGKQAYMTEDPQFLMISMLDCSDNGILR